jgi:poly-gamma-glutamate synthesis protein (capsule biosynthesis protein)
MNKEEAYRAYRVTVKGVSLSFLSVCENEFGIATETAPGAAGFHLKYLRDRIVEEKKEAEFVIVIFHGGNEQNPVPAPVVIDRYRLLIDLGADAVVAGHTHCMQGAELYCGKPIIYSMGNYFFPSGTRSDDDPWLWGYLTALTVERGVGITYNPIPYVLRENNTHLHVLDGAQREVVLRYIDRLSAIIADPAEVRRYYEAWATHLGAWYISRFDYKKEYETSAITKEQLWEFSPTKNLLGCEAHNDLIKTLTQLVYEGRFDQAHAHLDDLLELQKIPQS